jgi:DNA/RNA-binding domain of Phe-tRNA-synthetase-like protein
VSAPAIPAVRLAGDVAGAVGLGVLAFEALTVELRDATLDAALDAAAAALGAGGGAEADMAATRAMYRRLGLDPTKTRPSSEALLRRIRKGEGLPRINTLVDVCNWCSAEFQLPYGLYDLDHIKGDVELRLGREGEAYPGIRKDAVHLAGRPTLADGVGPFGNPSSDSARTMVTPTATRALVVVYAPRDQAARRLGPVLDVTAARITRHARGAERYRAVVAGGPAV